MTEQLKDIGMRLGALRESVGLEAAELAAKLDVTTEEYTAYERGERDFSFSFLYNAAQALNVDVLDILSGESPKLSTACVVRAGGGYDINRRAAYDYKHLAFTFRNKLAEPFMVTVHPKDTKPEQHAHPGQEFNYIVSGAIEFFIGDIVYSLGEGDSVFFNAEVPHAMRAISAEPAKFLAIVVK